MFGVTGLGVYYCNESYSAMYFQLQAINYYLFILICFTRPLYSYLQFFTTYKNKHY